MSQKNVRDIMAVIGAVVELAGLVDRLKRIAEKLAAGGEINKASLSAGDQEVLAAMQAWGSVDDDEPDGGEEVAS